MIRGRCIRQINKANKKYKIISGIQTQPRKKAADDSGMNKSIGPMTINPQIAIATRNEAEEEADL